jgi:hypothetical protein
MAPMAVTSHKEATNISVLRSDAFEVMLFSFFGQDGW